MHIEINILLIVREQDTDCWLISSVKNGNLLWC
jgi:hypothetical protein